MSTSYDEDEEIKRRKLLELQKKLAEEEERRKRELEKEALLRSILTPKARQRLANIKLVKPELANILESQIIQLVQLGRIKPPVTDDIVKAILIELDRRSRREIRFKIYRR
ncbi:MAG TPA: DNA-binding protein [Thermoproteales archaeon]|nr:DNA-binding protein [Thermoproteales archaeon]